MGAYMSLFNPYNQTVTSINLIEILNMKLKMAQLEITTQTWILLTEKITSTLRILRLKLESLDYTWTF